MYSPHVCRYIGLLAHYAFEGQTRAGYCIILNLNISGLRMMVKPTGDGSSGVLKDKTPPFEDVMRKSGSKDFRQKLTL